MPVEQLERNSVFSAAERLNLLQMEMEMEQLSRAFGMPSVFGGPTTSLFDMMPAAELPTTMSTMAARSLVSRTAAGLVCEAHTLAHLTGRVSGARQHCLLGRWCCRLITPPTSPAQAPPTHPQAVDVKDTGTALEIHADVPGM